MSRISKAKYLLLILGALLLAALIHQVGWNQVIVELKLIGWGLIPFICIHALKEALSTSAWLATFPDTQNCNWWKLYCITWAGSAISKIYHTGILGGETTKVVLMRRDVSTQEGIASVIIAKLAEASAQILFILTGIFFVFRMLEFPERLETALLIALALLVTSVLLFGIYQRKGLLGAAISLLAMTPLPKHLIIKMRQRTGVLDESIRTYYRSRPRAFWGAVSLNLFRQLLDLAQVQLVLSLMGVPGGFLRCFFISVFSALVNSLFFFIPGRLGAQEGGKILIAGALGMSPAQGLTLGIVSRLCQIIWSLLGLLVLFLWQGTVSNKGSLKNGDLI